jgi:omega-6 fatty acid desaturase (delta-12 desaturase)
VMLFMFRERFPSGKASPRERRSVWWMNLALVCMVAFLTKVLGPQYLILQVIVMAVGGAVGVWIFYIQHQFEDVYWARGDEWDQTAAALQGSSYFQLPRILQWFTGNIGFHHIHHLSSRIPNYNLERCHNAHPSFSQVKGITLWRSLKAIRYRLWDEEGGKLVDFRAIRHLARTYRGSADCA